MNTIISSLNSAVLSSLPLSAEIYTVNLESENEDLLTSKFAVFSDLHLNIRAGESLDDPYTPGKGNGRTDLARALSVCKNENISFLAACGDIGDAPNAFNTTNALLESVVAETNPNFPIYLVKGNHDQNLTDEHWSMLNKFGDAGVLQANDQNYSFEDDYNKYVFLSVKKLEDTEGNASSATQSEPYPAEAIECLQSALSGDCSKTVHVFMHFPLNALRPEPQFAGLGNTEYKGGPDAVDQYGFSVINDTANKIWKNEQNTLILDMLKEYPGTSIVYSGHSHYIQQVELYIPNVMVAQAAENVWTVHIPSLNYPRNRARTVIASTHPLLQPSQGFIVECYSTCIILKCIEFNENCSCIPNQVLKEYVVPLKA